jgi:beta-xylosidase
MIPILAALGLATSFLFPQIVSCQEEASTRKILNPILPGAHPDPSCIHVEEEDNTVFCASSSFNIFPGIPIHASKDLSTWRLIGKALHFFPFMI